MYGYRRSRGTAAYSGSSGNRMGQRIRTLLTVLLLIGLIVSLVTGLPAIRANKDTDSFIVNRLATECKSAYDLTQTLSLTASTSSHEKLSRIRSSVYGMEMLVRAKAVEDGTGKLLIEESVFESLYTLIESYNNQLIKGMSTTNLVTELQSSLSALLAQIEAMQ